jgi:hypothetical protein
MVDVPPLCALFAEGCGIYDPEGETVDVPPSPTVIGTPVPEVGRVKVPLLIPPAPPPPAPEL